MKHVTGPIVLLVAGLALVLVHLSGRRHRATLTRAERRAGLRLLWDLAVGAVVLFFFSCWMLAPRNVMAQRVSRPKARRMVQALDADRARDLIS